MFTPRMEGETVEDQSERVACPPLGSRGSGRRFLLSLERLAHQSLDISVSFSSLHEGASLARREVFAAMNDSELHQ